MIIEASRTTGYRYVIAEELETTLPSREPIKKRRVLDPEEYTEHQRRQRRLKEARPRSIKELPLAKTPDNQKTYDVRDRYVGGPGLVEVVTIPATGAPVIHVDHLLRAVVHPESRDVTLHFEGDHGPRDNFTRTYQYGKTPCFLGFSSKYKLLS